MKIWFRHQVGGGQAGWRAGTVPQGSNRTAIAGSDSAVHRVILFSDDSSPGSLCPAISSSSADMYKMKAMIQQARVNDPHASKREVGNMCGRVALTGTECVEQGEHGSLVVDLPCLGCHVSMHVDWELVWTCGHAA